MKTRFIQPTLSALILGVMLLALTALATLQYRWSAQLSQAYEQRMQATLTTATHSLRSTVQMELAALSRSVQVSSAESIHHLHLAVAARARTLSAANPPHALYVVQAPTMMLAAYRPSSSDFQPIPWPSKLQSLRGELLVHMEDLERASARRRHVRPWLASATAPVLFRAVEGADGESLDAFILIEIDALRYFAQLHDRLFRASGLDSRLAVLIADTTIYDSDRLASPLPSLPSLDVWANLPGGSRSAPRSAVEDSSWRIIAAHRAGTLDAAVASNRYRNLAAGFGVCLILCGGMVFLAYNTRRAQQIAQLQSSFVAGFSHELRTPIAAVCVLAENLRDGISSDPQQVRRYGSLLLEQGHRLRAMIEQILAFASNQHGPLQLQPVSISDMVADVLREDATLLDGMVIDVVIPPRLPHVLADRDTLKSCVANLIANAAKYARPGAWIGITAQLQEASGIALTISDRGPGIDHKELLHVFEPFYRGSDARAKLIPGAGLGLHLVRRRMESLQGRVTINSVPGQGCAVTLHLRSISV